MDIVRDLDSCRATSQFMQYGLYEENAEPIIKDFLLKIDRKMREILRLFLLA